MGKTRIIIEKCATRFRTELHGILDTLPPKARLAVIAGMLYSVLRYRGAYAAWFRFAALLFVFSDGVIAWSRFIGAVPGRTYVVMVPYYLAQCLFFCFAVKSLPALPSEGRSV